MDTLPFPPQCQFCSRAATYRVHLYGTPLPPLWTCDEHALEIEDEVKAAFDQAAGAQKSGDGRHPCPENN